MNFNSSKVKRIISVVLVAILVLAMVLPTVLWAIN